MYTDNKIWCMVYILIFHSLLVIPEIMKAYLEMQ